MKISVACIRDKRRFAVYTYSHIVRKFNTISTFVDVNALC